jgi:hypothetical protein
MGGSLRFFGFVIPEKLVPKSIAIASVGFSTAGVIGSSCWYAISKKKIKSLVAIFVDGVNILEVERT